MHTKLTILERLKDLRVSEKRMSLQELSDATGIPSSTLGNYEKDKNKVRSILFLKTPDNNEYVVTRNGKDVLIKRNIGQETIVKGSDEYKNILAQSNDFIKQFFVKYKTALGLQRQVNESLRNFG